MSEEDYGQVGLDTLGDPEEERYLPGEWGFPSSKRSHICGTHLKTYEHICSVLECCLEQLSAGWTTCVPSHSCMGCPRRGQRSGCLALEPPPVKGQENSYLNLHLLCSTSQLVILSSPPLLLQASVCPKPHLMALHFHGTLQAESPKRIQETGDTHLEGEIWGQ